MSSEFRDTRLRLQWYRRVVGGEGISWKELGEEEIEEDDGLGGEGILGSGGWPG